LTELQLHHTAEASSDTVVVRGEIDMATAPQLRDLLEELVSGGSQRIVLDCRDLEFLDSSGIGVLVAARNRMGDAGEMVIDSPTPHVLKVLEITGVSEHLSVIASGS
jgi:anti-sigma B factor antagonist